MRPIKLAIISTHPVQYYAPVFRGLASSQSLVPRVFYTWSQSGAGSQHEPDFGTTVRWDIPLLDGYEHEFVTNIGTDPTPTRFFGLRAPDLVPRIREWGADAVLVYGWNHAAHLAAMIRLGRHMPVFFRGDSTLLDALPPLRRALRRLMLRTIYRSIDVAIAVGANNRDYFRWCGVADTNIELAPHSVDTVRFAADDAIREAEARDWRSRLGIAPDALVFAFAGKFLPKKDPLTLIDAFRAMRQRGAQLVLFGGGPLAAAIAERVNGDACIHVLPFENQSRMPSVYRVGDVFVLPSAGPGETWGLALNEAMACGRPVIASSRVGGAVDLVVPGETGWAFPAADGAALTQVLDAAAALPRAELQAMGVRARARAEYGSTEECVRRIADIVIRRAGHSAASSNSAGSSNCTAGADQPTSLVQGRGANP